MYGFSLLCGWHCDEGKTFDPSRDRVNPTWILTGEGPRYLVPSSLPPSAAFHRIGGENRLRSFRKGPLFGRCHRELAEKTTSFRSNKVCLTSQVKRCIDSRVERMTRKYHCPSSFMAVRAYMVLAGRRPES